MDIYKHIVEHHLQKVKEIMPNWETHLVGVFLYGSQNYNADTEESDIDTKAIYVPTLKQLATQNPDQAKTLTLDNGEKCELMTITHFVNNLYKQNINFVEVIFTKHFWINPRYSPLWNLYFTSYKETIARYDIDRGILSMTGQALHTLSQYDGTNPKKIANVQRLLWFIENLLENKNYADCLVLDEKQRVFVTTCKKGGYDFPQEYMENLTNYFTTRQQLTLENPHPINDNIGELLELSIQHFIKRGLLYDEQNF